MKKLVKVAIGMAAVFCAFGFAFKQSQDRKIENIHENIRSDNASKAAEIEKQLDEIQESINSLRGLMIQNQREIESIKNVMSISDMMQSSSSTSQSSQSIRDSESAKRNLASDEVFEEVSREYEIENPEEDDAAFLDRLYSDDRRKRATGLGFGLGRGVKGMNYDRIERRDREFFETMNDGTRREFRRRVASEMERQRAFFLQNVPEEMRDFVEGKLPQEVMETLRDAVKIRVLGRMRAESEW